MKRLLLALLLLGLAFGQTWADVTIPGIPPVATTKGDIVVYNGHSYVRFPVGTTGYLISVDPTTATGLKYVAPGGGGTWGSITGTLSSQTDLQNALNAKLSLSVTNTASSATPTPAVGTSGAEIQYNLTALAEAATFQIPTGTPTSGQKLIIRIKDDNNGPYALDFTTATSYRAIGIMFPTTTVSNKTLYLSFRYNAADSKWDCLGVSQEQ